MPLTARCGFHGSSRARDVMIIPTPTAACTSPTRPLSCIAEQLAPFRGQRLAASMLRRRGLPLALAELELADTAVLIDLDNPVVLESRTTEAVARGHHGPLGHAASGTCALHNRHPDAAGLQWWSSWEALWTNVTVLRSRGATTAPSFRSRADTRAPDAPRSC